MICLKAFQFSFVFVVYVCVCVCIYQMCTLYESWAFSLLVWALWLLVTLIKTQFLKFGFWGKEYRIQKWM